MSHKYVLLKEVCEKASSNIAQKDLAECDGIYPIYGASGYIKSVDFFQQAKDYIAIVKDGAGIGRAMKLPAKSSVIGTMQYILPNDNINISYLYYAICSMHLEKYFSGATIPHIYFRDYQNEQLPLPTLEEQAKIANVFGKIDYFIKKEKEQLINLDKLVKSRFIEMFGDPVINSKGWITKRLPELGTLSRGMSKHRPRNAPELLGGPYPLIQTGDVANADGYIKEYTSTYSELGFRQSKMWPKGTLCITIAANIAKTAILEFASCFPDSIVGFNAYSDVTNEYIHHWFTFVQRIIEEQAPESAQKNINMKILSNLKVMVPDKNIQHEYVDFLKQVDKSKLAIQQSLDELETLKKSLMQQYFG